MQLTGADLTFAQLESVWIQAGGSATLAPLMAAIALAESSGDPTATNPTDNNGTQTSWGLWQISTGNHDEPNPDWADPLENAKLAVAKWNSQGLWAWGTYTSGAYKKYLPNGYVAPNSDIPGVGGATEGGQGAAGTVTTEGSWTSGLGTVWSDATSGLVTIPGVVLGTFGDVDKGVAALYNHLALFFQPSTYVRIGAGVVGGLCLVAAIVFMVKEANA